ncbi:MAG: cytidine deaminase [Firmicutes bacterium]|nr:cytidine deaminase [Bacillota bacterium]
MKARTLADSFRFAVAGVAYTWRTQRNFRIHTAAGAAVAAAARALGVGGPELGLLILCIGGVMAAELLNTAVEAAVDLCTGDHHPLAAAAKNAAAGAVLLSAAASAAVGYVVFAPHLPAALAALSGGTLGALALLVPRGPKAAREGTGMGEGSGQQAVTNGLIDVDALIKAARQARKQAYAPYSRFPVGAAILTKGGRIVTGCNIENASYPVTLCAERVALGAAVASGEREFLAIAVVADTDEPVTPCGMCRQSLAEFAPDLVVILANGKGQRRITTLAELLPGGFRLPEGRSEA